MQDMVIKGTGNSRYLKSVEDFMTRYPNYEAFAQALVAGNLPIDLNGTNAAGITTAGTPLNKNNLLKDATAELFGLSANAVPDDVFAKLAETANIGNLVIDCIESSRNWLAPKAKDQKFKVLMCGGGGSGAFNIKSQPGGGGGSGHIATGEFVIAENTSVPCVIGAGGAQPTSTDVADGNNGGQSKFGSYLTADGGNGATGPNGGDGGAGGGAGEDGNGGNGSFGGGGGAHSAYVAGNGGVYGGGGGSHNGTAGTGGTYGGNGSTEKGSAGSAGVPIHNMPILDFLFRLVPVCTASGGAGTTNEKSKGAAGGGGYGGNGGDCNSGNSYNGGSGGGGYGGNGGKGNSGSGGGGGYGCNGGDGRSSGGGGGGGGLFGDGGSGVAASDATNASIVGGKKYGGGGGGGAFNSSDVARPGAGADGVIFVVYFKED